MRILLWLLVLAAIAIGVASATTYGQVAIIPNSNACTWRLYSALPDETQVITVGSSRIRRGVEPDVMTEALGLPPAGVVNLAHPAISLPFDLGHVRRLSEDHPLKVAIFGVVARSEALHAAERAIDPGGNTRFDVSLNIGDINQLYLLGTPMRESAGLVMRLTENRLIAVWDVTRLYAGRMQRFVPAVLTRSLLTRMQAEGGTDPDRLQDCRLTRWVEPSDAAQNGPPRARQLREAYQATFPAFTDPAPLGFLTEPESALDRAVIGEMIELARSRDIEPVFLYLPGIGVPVDPQLDAAFEAAFGAPLWIPPEPLRDAMEDGGYFDNSHLNNAGRALFSAWLAEKLAPLLDTAPR